MAFEDYRDRILFAMISLAVPGIIWMVVQVIHSVTHDDVEKMIVQARETDHYMRDRDGIMRNLQILESLQVKNATDLERLRDNTFGNNEKIWRELALIRIELERIRVHENDAAFKKKAD